MRLIREWRWYTWVAVCLWASTAAILVLALARPIIDSLAVIFGRATSVPGHAAWPMLLAAGTSLLTLAWQHYVVPVMASADVAFKDHRTPRMLLRNYLLSLWMPCIVATIICVTNLVPVYVGRMTLMKWISVQPWILWVVAALPLLAMPPLLLTRSVKRRLRGNARRQARCLECGYHLLGVWSSSCPECGTPRLDVGQMQPDDAPHTAAT